MAKRLYDAMRESWNQVLGNGSFRFHENGFDISVSRLKGRSVEMTVDYSPSLDLNLDETYRDATNYLFCEGSKGNRYWVERSSNNGNDHTFDINGILPMGSRIVIPKFSLFGKTLLWKDIYYDKNPVTDCVRDQVVHIRYNFIDRGEERSYSRAHITVINCERAFLRSDLKVPVRATEILLGIGE
ncbi:hypothetical protein GOV12_00285 [Candidatus Pacearchaeota archaeon]|nr:hypothetical protein [Candidatus Pacearchaeota archaeon]